MNLWVAAILVGSALLIEVPGAQARSELSSQLSVPIASVVDSAGTLASEGVSAAAVLPVALSEAGASLVVLAVTEGAKGSVYALQRVGDGARVSIEIAGEVARAVALGVGTTIEVSTVATGTVLSVAGEVIALIPTEVGLALMHHEQLSD